MKSLSILALVVLLGISGCSFKQRSAESVLSNPGAELKQGRVAEQEKSFGNSQTEPGDNYSFNRVAKSSAVDAALERKIIRDADLTIEVNSTTEAQQRVTTIAETHGGFVVTSEARQRENSDPAKRTVDIKLVLRVPASEFNAALEQIEKLATNLPHRNVSGQDVTEEFIDLEARIKTQKALELQFLEIMKQATKVGDALEVQRQIADVRTEIEKLEGRKRFLESRSSFSTITVNIQAPVPIVVSASGFGHTVREAVSESIEVASHIVLFFVRFVIVMAPIFVIVILPGILAALYLRRRAQRIRLASELAATPISE